MILPKDFIERKKLFLTKLNEALKMNLVDEDIIDVLLLMNELPIVYTTSSCSGRIFLIDVPHVGRKDLSVKVAKWHSAVEWEVFYRKVSEYEPKGVLWLKVEGMIIAFAVPSIEWASFFLKLSRFLGFKDSGVRSIPLHTSQVFLDVMSTEKMHIPIAMREKGLLVSEQTLRIWHAIANWLLRRTKAKLFIWKKAIERLKEILEEGVEEPASISMKRFSDLQELKRAMLRRIGDLPPGERR